MADLCADQPRRIIISGRPRSIFLISCRRVNSASKVIRRLKGPLNIET